MEHELEVPPECLFHYAHPPLDFSTHEMVTLKVGDGMRELHVHQQVVHHHSTYFQEVIEDRHQQGQTTTILLLPDDEYDVVKTAVYWMYTGRFHPAESSSEMGPIPFSTHFVCQLAVFAEHYGARPMQNSALSLLFRKITAETMARTTIQYVYDNTTCDSPLRWFVVDYHVETKLFLQDRRLDVAYPQFLLDCDVTVQHHEGRPNWQFTHREFVRRQMAGHHFCEWYHVHPEFDELEEGEIRE